MLDVFSSIGEDVMVGVGCTARRDARNSDLLKIDEIDPTYAWTLPHEYNLEYYFFRFSPTHAAGHLVFFSLTQHYGI